jgi:hypothetical protein
MKKANTKKGSNKAGSKNSKAKKPSKQQQEINQALGAAAAAQASANSANAAAAANAAALSTSTSQAAAALSTANSQGAAALSTATSQAAAALSTANASNAAALSTANSQGAAALSTTNSQLSTSNSTIAVLSTSTASNAAEELQNAVNNLALVAFNPGIGELSIVGGTAANTYFATNTIASYVSTGPSATLNGNNFLNLPSAITGTAPGNWYFIGGPGDDTFIGNSSANTFLGGLGNDVITSGGGADSINGGAGSNRFNFANGDLTSSVKLVGGSTSGTNFIEFTNQTTIADSAFANVSQVTEVYGSTAGLNISVGSSAQAAGVSYIEGAAISANSFSDVLTSGTVPFNFIGGNENDTFSFAIGSRLAADYVTGGIGFNQVVITSDGQSLADTAFARIAAGTIQSLSLAGGNNSVIFGTNADRAGFTTSTTGSGDDYISVQSGFTTGNAIFNSGSGNDTFVIGSTVASTFIGGLGDDTFSTAQTGSLTFASSLSGGSGTNVLAFTGTGASVVDNDFAHVSGIQAITSVGTLSAVLTLTAEQAGIVSVSGSTGADTIAYEGTTAITFTGGSGADNFAVSGGVTSASTFSGGDANDTFTFATIGQLAAASVDGGAGSNGVVFSGGVSATDANFNRIAAGTMQALTVTGSASSIIVGSNAIAAGITNISGGAGDDTITANFGTNAVTLAGGGGADLLSATSSLNATFSFADTTNYGGSTASGSALGTNTLAFAQGVTFIDSDFTRVANIQTLALNGTAGSDITVGVDAGATGFTTITAAGATTGSIITLGNFTNAISFVGSAGNDTFVVGSGAGFTSASSINAGAGTADVISYGIAGGTVTDTIFQKITAGTAEVLSATSSTNITVGSNALNAGIRTFSAGTGAVAFTVSSGFGTNGMNLTGSTNNDTFTFVDGSALGNSTVNGGVGADSIVFTNAVTITSIANVSNVETISLNGTSSSTLTIGNGGVFGTNTLTISGTAAANSIDASSRTSAAINYLGSNSADSFTGGGSNDTLQGWATANSSTIDTLTGGNGADVFVLATGYDGTAIGTLGYAVSGTNSGYAIITDFGLNDKISLGGINATTGAGATAGGIVVSALGSTGFSIQLSGVEIARATYAGGATSAQFI